MQPLCSSLLPSRPLLRKVLQPVLRLRRLATPATHPVRAEQPESPPAAAQPALGFSNRAPRTFSPRRATGRGKLHVRLITFVLVCCNFARASTSAFTLVRLPAKTGHFMKSGPWGVRESSIFTAPAAKQAAKKLIHSSFRGAFFAEESLFYWS